MRIQITARAEDDLRQIGEYIARDSLVQADEFLSKLRSFIFGIGDNPLRYRLRAEWGQDVRAANYGNYLVIFEHQSEMIIILRVSSGRRNIAGLLSEA